MKPRTNTEYKYNYITLYTKHTLSGDMDMGHVIKIDRSLSSCFCFLLYSKLVAYPEPSWWIEYCINIVNRMTSCIFDLLVVSNAEGPHNFIVIWWSDWKVNIRSCLFSGCREGTWKDGGHCDTNTSPETNYTRLDPEPHNNFFISKIIREIEIAKRKAYFLNITFMSEFRKDGHPSNHREPGTPVEAPQDCSHWCLPGVPDTWNELLYAHLLSKGFRNLIIWTRFPSLRNFIYE